MFGITDVDDDDVCDCVFVRIDNGGGDGVGVDKWTTKFDFLVDKKVAGGGGGGGGGGGIGIEVKGCFWRIGFIMTGYQMSKRKFTLACLLMR